MCPAPCTTKTQTGIRESNPGYRYVCICPGGCRLPGELQQKLAAVKQSVAQNQQKLHQYQWTETTQLTLKGEPKPPKTLQCQYGPDGKVQKTPVGSPPHPPAERPGEG